MSKSKEEPKELAVVDALYELISSLSKPNDPFMLMLKSMLPKRDTIAVMLKKDENMRKNFQMIMVKLKAIVDGYYSAP